MQRREILKRLFLAGTTPALVAPIAARSPRVDPWDALDVEFGPFVVHGAYRYHWTGLKRNIDNSYLVGQWLAWPAETPCDDDHVPYLYVNVPGFVGGCYAPGHVFNLQSNGRFILSGATSPDQAREWILRGRLYLHRLMGTYERTRARDLLYHVYPVYNLEGVTIASL